MMEFITSCDWAILHWIQKTLTSPVLDYLMPRITWLGNGGMIWILIGVFLMITKRYRRCGIILLIGLAVGGIIGNLFLKNMIARQRPSWIDQSVLLLISNPTDYSFPSGHTLSSVIAATILTLSNKKIGFVAIPLAALIACSRLYLYVHFPSDILGGIVLGVFIGVVTFFCCRITKKSIEIGK